ncbi:MAG: hypothetical protein ACJ76Z_11320 [Thermoleophilaceae bacterium]
MPARFEGRVVVHFDGPAGNGTIVWTPPPRGQMTVAEVKRRGKLPEMDGFLGTSGGSGADVAARVVSRDGGVCTDAQSGLFAQASTESLRSGIRFALAGAAARTGGFQMTETRCGGPLSADLSGVLPVVQVPRARLRKGGFDLDFRRSGPLSTADMTGTVESTVVVHVGKRNPAQRRPRFPERKHAYKQLSVAYRITEVTGRLTAAFQGGGELCAELDSCGATATATLDPGGAATGDAELSVLAPAKRPLRDLRAALGLSRGGRAGGLQVQGFGSWVSGRGTLTATVARGDAQTCADSRPIEGSAFVLQRRGGDLRATLIGPSTANVIRTRCPGPSLLDASADAPLATGAVPLRALAHRRVVIHLTSGGPRVTDGWQGTAAGDLTVVLRRGKARLTRVRF